MKPRFVSETELLFGEQQRWRRGDQFNVLWSVDPHPIIAQVSSMFHLIASLYVFMCLCVYQTHSVFAWKAAQVSCLLLS